MVARAAADSACRRSAHDAFILEVDRQLAQFTQTHAAEIEKAYNEENKDRSVELWQGIFGDGFKAPATSSSSTKFPVAPVPATTVGRSGRAG